MASSEGHWRDHRVLAAVVRTVAVVGPLAVGMALGLCVAVVLPKPTAPLAFLGWWALVLATSAAAFRLTDRLARRALPLAVLLELSLLFPEQAPSRFRVALKGGSTKHLHEHLAAAQRAGVEGDGDEAAQAILTLAAALAAHHRPSRKHSERVRAYTELVAEELGLSERDRHRLRWASLLHDVGKVSVPHEILEGTGELSRESWEVIQRHPMEGARLIAPLREWLGPWATTVEQHHERWDGGGYPLALSGEDISMGARIVAVADSFEAMTAKRSYQDPMPIDAARARVASLAGTQFDPAVVRAFLAVSVRRLRWAYGPLGWLAEAPVLFALSKAAPAVASAGLTLAASSAGVLPDVQVLGETFERESPGPRTPIDPTPPTSTGRPDTAAVTSTTTSAPSPSASPWPSATTASTAPTTSPTTASTMTVPRLPPVTTPPVPGVTVTTLPLPPVRTNPPMGTTVPSIP